MRLLIATGGSSHSNAALHLAACISRAHYSAGKATILTVIGHPARRRRAERILVRAREQLESEGLETETKIRLGRRIAEIVGEAEEGHFDLLILGERVGHRLITRYLGSIATRVAAKAPCPVIIVKDKVDTIGRILLCDSGAQDPSLLDRFSTQLPHLVAGEIELTVLHVMSQMSAGPGVRGKELRAGAEELIEKHTPEGELFAQDIRILEKSDVHPRPKVRHGLVVDEILTEARSDQYDLVVIGAHCQEGWQRLLLDDLAHKIMVKVDRPILIIR